MAYAVFCQVLLVVGLVTMLTLSQMRIAARRHGDMERAQQLRARERQLLIGVLTLGLVGLTASLIIST